jgi:4-hydroxyacetophenone monooxygenase
LPCSEENGTVRRELLEASDATIDDAIEHADPMVLRGLIYQLTGDQEILQMEMTTEQFANFYVTRIAKESDVALLRRKAAAFLKGYRDGGAGDIELGSPERLYRSLSLTAGVDLPERERELWLEQTALDPWARELKWPVQPRPEQREGFKVGVIGAGLSGLNVAVMLKRAGIPFAVFEKNPEVGGTWFENNYPGARVDSPSRSYTHLFGVSFPYPYCFCPRDENLKYLRWVADHFAVRDRIAFDTEIESVVWDDARDEWVLTARGPSGEIVERVNAVISCVGFLSRPKLPEIAGMETFGGVACHTAQWPPDLDVTGKRVAVIGSGASGYQTAPEIAKQASHTYLFQRTPSWCYENPSYIHPLPEQSTWLDRNFPFLVNFARFHLSFMYGPDNVKAAARRDPAFEDPHAGSAANKRARDDRIAFIRRKLSGRPDLIEKMIPLAPPMSSRPVMIDAEESIFEALLRDDVTLVSDPIERITAKGIRAGGTEHQVDVIVYATGFKASDFLWPMEVRGRRGVKIEDLWARDGARAYIGSMLPGFPNFFMAYGPNTNNFGGFQIIDLLEIEIRFALQCIAGLITQDKRTVEVTDDAYRRFNEELDREESFMLYMDPRVSNYYRNQHGRSAVNCPIDFRRMWSWLRDPTGPVPAQSDAGVTPRFGADLVVR